MKKNTLQKVLTENSYLAWTQNRVKLKITAPTVQDKKPKGHLHLPILHLTAKDSIWLLYIPKG